jgi:hypothetical protein
VDSWFFGLDAWPIQDGSYPDFRIGQTAEFDVAFHMPEWDIASDAVAPGCQRLEECRYSIIAEVVATLDHHAWVIDCGINAFRRGPLPEGLAKGSWVAGEADLFLDPYGGVDDSLVRRWHVRRILRKRVERWRGERHWARKPWEVIEATNAWVDDAHPYAAAYILECELLSQDDPPVHRA